MAALFQDDFTLSPGILDGRVAVSGQPWVENTPGTISCDASGAFVTGAVNRSATVPAAVAAELPTSVEFSVTSNTSTAGWGVTVGLLSGSDLVGLDVSRSGASINVRVTEFPAGGGTLVYTLPHVSGENHVYRLDYASGSVTVFVDDALVYGPAAFAYSPGGRYPHLRIQNLGSGVSNQIRVPYMLVEQGDAPNFWTNFRRTTEVI